MGFKVGAAIPIGYYYGSSGQTINARIEDESGGVFGPVLTLTENAAFVAVGITGYYESSFTPDAVGRWTALVYSTTVKYGQMFYDVGGSLTTQEKADVEAEAVDALESFDLDHLLGVAHPTGDPVVDTIIDLIMNKDVGQTYSRATDSLEILGELLAALAADVGVFPTANYATLAAYVEDVRTRLIAIVADTGTIVWGDITGIVNDIGVFPTANYATLAAYVEDIRTRLVAYATAIGSEFDGTPDVYDVLVTGFVDAVTATVQGSILERLELLQDVSIGGNVVFTATGSAVGTLTAAALIDQAGAYVGSMVVPITGTMAGHGRYITAYDGTQTITVLPVWPVDPSNPNFVIVPSEAGRLLLATGAEFDGTPNIYDVEVTGYTGAATAVIQGSILERLEALQDVLITGNVIYTATGSSTTTLVVAALLDVANNYIGQMAIPLAGDMTGQGRYITAYNGTTTVTVAPAWAADPGSVDFVIVPSENGIIYDALVGANGVAAWPGGAAPAANVSIQEVIEEIYDNVNEVRERKAIKTLTFANLVAAANLFTVTGSVIAKVTAICTDNVASGAAGNIEVGIAADPDNIIATTVASTIIAGEIWHDATSDAEIELLSVRAERIIADGNDIILTPSAQIDTGTIVFVCMWTPLEAGSTVAAA